MKAQILKIAGVKSEKEFYKKYPSETAFMKVHGKEFKKAQMGTYIGGDSMKAPKPINYQDYYDDVDKQLTGTTEQERLDMAAKQASIAAASKPSGGGLDISSIMGMLGGEGGGEGAGGLMSMLGGAKYGTRIPKAQFGNDIEGPLSSTPGFVEGMGMDSVNGYGVDNSGNATNSYSAPKKSFDFAKGASLLGPVGGAINAFGEQRKQKNAAKQSMLLSGLSLDLSRMRPEQTERKYVTPWDNPVQPEQMFPTYGVGTNVLTGRNGVRLQSGGEIQNTYAHNNLYDDLGYEPLNNSNVKQYQAGGAIAGNMAGNMAGNFIGSEFNNNAGYQAGSAIGGFSDFILPGSSAIVSPILGAIGGGLDQAFGDAGKISRYQQNTKRNIENTVMNNMAPSIQAGYASHLQNGGYMNPEYNPQVIARFGELDAQDFAEFAHKDQYRAGGHLKSYTPPSDRAMETYAMGGQLKTHWGGEAETMSYNPYSAGSGETVVFRGQSHNDSDRKGNTGIGITYGENPVEVERGEPMFEMEAGGDINPMTGEPENTGVVFGNMEINKKIASQLNDDELMSIADKYHGKKFKNVGIDLAKQEVRQNKIIDKSTNELDNLQVNTSFDKLKLSALKANLEGANLKLKDIANTKISLANYQNAINDTKEEMSDYLGNNISAEHLAKGLIKIDKDPVTKDAKWGGDIAKKAKDGITTTKETTAIPKKTKEQLKAEGYVLGEDGKYHLKKKGVKKPDTETKSAKAMDNIPAQKLDKATGFAGGVTKEKFEEFKKRFPDYPGIEKLDPKDPKSLTDFKTWANNKAKTMGSNARIMDDPKTTNNPQGLPIFGDQYLSFTIDESKKSEPATEEELIAEEAVPDAIPEAKSKFPWEIPVNMALDYLRPTDQSGLDYNQLMGEMYAMSNNQVEPVQAQLYNPELGVPYDISLQDQLNANQADFNSLQRLYANNPFALAQLNAQKYAANEKVLGEQFRANQAMKDKVYGDNRQTLNQAKLANLGILDKQYERQSAALSNTKATTQAALNSMSDKYAKNKLENRKLSIYENMYNYRFGKSGRAQNYNGLQLFDTQASAGKGEDDIPEGYKVTGYDANKNPRLARITEKDMKEDEAALEAAGGIPLKNGGTSKKNYKNSSVVRAYKNL